MLSGLCRSALRNAYQQIFVEFGAEKLLESEIGVRIDVSVLESFTSHVANYYKLYRFVCKGSVFCRFLKSMIRKKSIHA